MTEDLSFRQDELPEDRSLIIVDDDRAFARASCAPWRRAASRCAAATRLPRGSS